jgi:hypothetical protein
VPAVILKGTATDRNLACAVSQSKHDALMTNAAQALFAVFVAIFALVGAARSPRRCDNDTIACWPIKVTFTLSAPSVLCTMWAEV